VPTPTATAPPDRATAERLAAAFNRCFETFEAPHEVFDPDAFFDLLPPLWRFQVQGTDALAAQLRAVAAGGRVESRVLRVVPTVSGFVMEQEETALRSPATQAAPGRSLAGAPSLAPESGSPTGQTREVARRLWLCEVVDGRITEALGYCNGGWDDELRARHAAEAPMLRP
jgi:hypothetical protein